MPMHTSMSREADVDCFISPAPTYVIFFITQYVLLGLLQDLDMRWEAQLGAKREERGKER
jgi:hypothetical protein